MKAEIRGHRKQDVGLSEIIRNNKKNIIKLNSTFIILVYTTFPLVFELSKRYSLDKAFYLKCCNVVCFSGTV